MYQSVNKCVLKRRPLGVLCGLIAVIALAACSDAKMLEVRDGPQAVHPSTGAVRALTAKASGQSSGATQTKSLFDTYCAAGSSNNIRVQAVINSGLFGDAVFGKLPLAAFEDVVFVFYTLKSGTAQIGFGSRRLVENYCIAVDGTAAGKELYIDGPAGRS
ncbi:hypothetical protein [Sulfitobacter guttiformis]|nr:hypothetical protein [Sulfitobacter guttiformis]